MIKNSRFSSVLFWSATFVFFSVLTLVVFHSRLNDLFTQYAMPDIDTDGGLWYQWYSIFTAAHALPFGLNQLVAYPFGFDIEYLPFSNLTYSAQIFILQHITGFSWQNLVFITNVSSLVTYPLSALSASILCFYLTKNKIASIVTGITFSFSFYHVFMARGQMSINHIEFIPLYFLSLFYFLDKKSRFSLVLSVLTFALVFKADAYYGFFSGFFSVIILLFYKQEKIKEKFSLLVKYYLLLFLTLVLINLNFFISNLYLFNTSTAHQSGRTTTVRNELTSMGYYFNSSFVLGRVQGDATKDVLPISYLYDVSSKLSYFLFIAPVAIVILGLLLYKKSRLYISLLLSFLFAVLVSTYIPILYWINQLYFRYFGIFRGVGRMILVGDLFLGLMIGLTLAFILKKYKKRKYLPLVVVSFIALVILLTGLNVDQTWFRRTDLSKTNTLYQPIKNDPNIKVIAPYPMDQRGIAVGCPGTYLIIAQIIHNKTYACGASPFSKISENYYSSISDISKPGTIGILEAHGVDSIIVYNKMEPGSNKINLQLEKDPRLKFIGRFTASSDKGDPSASDLSRDFNLYQIKKVVESNKKVIPLFQAADADVSFQKLDAYNYVLKLNNLKNTSTLIFSSPFSEKWKLYDNGSANKTAFFIGKKAVFESSHKRYKEFANSWVIDKNFIVKNFNKKNYHVNKDGSINVQISLFYSAQVIHFLASLITLSTFIFLIILLFYFYIHEKSRK